MRKSSRTKPLVINPFDSIVQQAARELGPAMDDVDVIKLESNCPGDKLAWVTNKDLMEGVPGKSKVIHLCLSKIKSKFQRQHQDSFTIQNPAEREKMKELVKDFLKYVVLPHETEHIHQELENRGEFGTNPEQGAEKAENWDEMEKRHGLIKKARGDSTFMHRISHTLDNIAESLESEGLLKEALEIDKISNTLDSIKTSADFIDPFPGMIPDRKMNDRELARALRLSLAAEEEAVHLYESLADATDNEQARKILQDIANEEKVHKGEFQKLLETLLPEEFDYMEEGKEEVEELDKMKVDRKPESQTDTQTPSGNS